MATVYRDGVSWDTELPAGLRTRQTAAPVFTSPETAAGATPLEVDRLRAGSYLAVVETEHGDSIRLPFVIERGKTTHVDLQVPSHVDVPGLRYVPGGRFRFGGDPQALFALPAEEPHVGGFWIQDVEVSAIDYATFLNDPGDARTSRDARCPVADPQILRPARGQPAVETRRERGSTRFPVVRTSRRAR